MAINVWGIENNDTSDVFGDDWGGFDGWWSGADRIIYPILDVVPSISDKIYIDFKARITKIETYDYDFFGTYININGKGGYRDDLKTWNYVTVQGDTFTWYRLILPADINGDSVVDWISGTNELHVWTWSTYNPNPGKTGVDILKLSTCPEISCNFSLT